MKKFIIKIWAYDHYATFEVLAEDSALSIEKAILDKLGEKSIKWESTGMFSDTRRITYEEVINDTRSRPLYEKEESRTGVVAAL